MTAEERIAELDDRGVELREIVRIVNREEKSNRWKARLVRAVLRQARNDDHNELEEARHNG